jgi:NAD(P)-dependent dehydrogenase (short-subunit alcohol dehydrogenase family)
VRLEGKRTFLTGAAAGIGAATAEVFRREGAVVHGVDVAGAEGVHHCDVTDPASVQAAVDAAAVEMGGIDVCANVAGVNLFCSLEHMTLDVWNRHLAVNLTGPMLVTQACLPHLRESTGNVVTVASISGIQGQPHNSSYCASKGGLRLFMKSIAVELASEGIRVNMVDPGGVATAMSDGALARPELVGEIDHGHFTRMTGVLPGGMMPPTRIAEALAFLASDASASTTGSELVVDGGTLW